MYEHLPAHPLTGLRAIGFTSRGPVWPAMGGSEDNDGTDTGAEFGFELPETLPETIDELETLRAEAQSAFEEVYPGPDADTAPSQEDVDQMTSLAEAISQIDSKLDEVRNAEAQRITAAEELAARVNGGRETDSNEGEGEGGDEFANGDNTEGGDQGDPAAGDGGDNTDEGDKNLTAGATKTGQKRQRRTFAGVGKANGRKPADAIRKDKKAIEGYSLQPGVPGYKGGPVSSLDIGSVVQRMLGGSRMHGTPNNSGNYVLATLSRQIPESLVASSDAEVFEIISRITDEKQLEGGSLTAAGGWCAVSETVYDFLGTEDAADLLDLPEFGISRGGIRFPIEPEFADLYADFSPDFFAYTEAQMIAAEADPDFQKPIIEIPCSEYDEVRLEAIGLGIGVDILSAKAWPEQTKKYVDELMKAHQHWLSARSIGKVVAGSKQITIGAGDVVANSAAVLNILELAAVDIRARHRIPSTATVEGFSTVWMKAAIRADIAYQQGVDVRNVTDAIIDSELATRGIRLQFVVDWQTSAPGLPGADPSADGSTAIKQWPSTIKVALYPAGTWYRSVEDVIEVTNVYDKANLQKNKYLELFTEDGFAVFRRATESRVYTIPLATRGTVGGRLDLSTP